MNPICSMSRDQAMIPLETYHIVNRYTGLQDSAKLNECVVSSPRTAVN